MSKTDELMSVSFDIGENEVPFLVFCSEFKIPMFNKSFVNSYISYYENDMKFKCGTMGVRLLTLKWYKEEDEILEVYTNKEFMGLVRASEIYTNLCLCSDQLVRLQHEWRGKESE